MTTLPSTERLLLGPGPSPVPPRVMRAMMAPVLGHLDPALLRFDGRPARGARADVSRTGRFARPGRIGHRHLRHGGGGGQPRRPRHARGVGGERLFRRSARGDGERYGGDGPARGSASGDGRCDAGALRAALEAGGGRLVAVVHAETSTGVQNPVQELAAAARAHDALVLVDAVTSLGGMPLDVAAWDMDACYSCSQKCLGAPSGLAPLVFTPRALERRVPAAASTWIWPAPGLLGEPQVSPHDLGDARLRAQRSAGHRRGGRPRGPLGAARTQPPCALDGARGDGPVAAAAATASGCGR